MFKHKFGESNVKTPEELKQVKIGSSARKRAAEVWSTDEYDALHVSILDSEIKRNEKKSTKFASNLINPFGVYDGEAVPLVEEPVDDKSIATDLVDSVPVLTPESNSEVITVASEQAEALVELDDESLDALFKELHSPQAGEVASPTAAADNATDSKQVTGNGLIGVYSPNLAFITSVQKELELLGEAWVYCFDGCQGTKALDSAPQLSSIDTWVINLTDDDESEVLDTILDASADASTMYLSGSILSKRCKQKLKDFIGEER